MFDVAPSMLDHWDSDTPVWTPFEPRRHDAAALDAPSGAGRRLDVRPNGSQSFARADCRGRMGSGSRA